MNRTGDLYMNRIALAVKSALGLAMLVPPALTVAAPADTSDLNEIVVVGIRKSVEQSIEAKRNSTELTEVVTSEDIGKMPDKNVADSLARLPGVTTSAAGANEGGFDENDRVSMRGTNPSLTQTLINGHGVAAGDWFVLDQVQQVGRSVSYTLLPSEIVSKVVVQKSSSASLVEGGVAGSVDIITRKPLDFSKTFTLEASAGAVYSDLPSKTDGQYSALANFKNDANNFGIMLQLFSETRDLRRDGIEVLGYDTIAGKDALGNPTAIAKSNPDLVGVQYPTDIGAAFFTQRRQRNGGMADLEFKPTDDLTLDLSGFSSRLIASNYNRNYLLWSTHFVNSGAGQAPDPGYVVQNNTLTKANFTGVTTFDPKTGKPNGVFYGVYDQISRPDETATANFVDLDTTWNASAALTFLGQVGYSWGDGKTPTQDVSETQPGLGSGAGYQLNGLGTGPNFNLGTTNNTTPTPGGVPVTFGWIFGAQDIDVKDNEKWAKIDGDYKIDNGAWKDLKFGVRYQAHNRTSDTGVAQGPLNTSPSAYPTTFSNYPSNFNTFGASIPTGIWYWTPAQLAAYNSPANVNRDPLGREYYQYLFQVHEKNTAGFVQADFKGDNWAANAGVRFVHTQEDVLFYTQVDKSTPGAILTSAFGPFIGVPVGHTYNDVLPSANLKLDLSPELVARFAAAETMTRADYSALAGFTNLSPAGCTQQGTVCVPNVGSGTGSNPDLKPIRSTNLDAGLEWYFAKSSLLSATAFYMDLRNYIGYGSEIKNYVTFNQDFKGVEVPYNLSVPVNAKGRVDGLELAYVQAFTQNLGFAGNYTYADGKQTSNVPPSPTGGPGDNRLVGTSKNTYNVSAYFENQMFNARVGYTYRSAFYSGLDRSTAFTQDAIGTLSASLGYTMNDHFSVSFDGMNLNNPTLKYYALNTTQPRAFYKNGSQYYLNFRFKL
ncbi:MAG TPA: TonB-dependent receptor [Steroidobacteraceae bacterium]|nr:TonB-dependent receptor [Steroidobacteraceae bacterium]